MMQVHCVCTWKSCKKQKVPGGGGGGAGAPALQGAKGGGGGGGEALGLLPYKRLMGMCCWMGSHFHDWSDHNNGLYFQ